MSANNIVLALQALPLQPGVQRIEAVKPGSRNQEVSPAIADDPLHIAFVVPLAGTAEPVFEQIMRLQFREGSGPHPFAVPEDLGDCDNGVVVEQRQGRAAEEGEGRVVAIAKGFGGLGRAGLHEERI